MKKVIFGILSLVILSTNVYAGVKANWQLYPSVISSTQDANNIEAATINGKHATKFLYTEHTAAAFDWIGSVLEHDDGYISAASETRFGYQCVGFVKGVAPGVNVHTSNWKPDTAVSADSLPAMGSVIATFNSNNKYFGHVAIYLSGNSEGIYVIDQNWDDTTFGVNWVGKIYTHFIPFDNSNSLTNNANNYYTVKI